MAQVSTAAFNGHDLTTSDLEGLRAMLPALLLERGLRLSAAAVARPADIYFSARDTSPEEVAEVAASAGSGLVFPEHEDFDPDGLAEDAPDPEIHPEVARIFTSANKRQGQLCRVTLHWAVSGLL